MRKILSVVSCAMMVAFTTVAQDESSKSSNPGISNPIPAMLEKLRSGIEARMSAIDAELSKAAAVMSVSGIEGAEARKVMLALIKTDPAILDSVTVNPAGKLATIEPEIYRSHEGADVSAQPHVKKMQTEKIPVVSSVFTAVEGMECIVFGHPVINKDGAFIGTVDALINPAMLIVSVARPIVKDETIDVWVAEKDGRILYDPDAEEIGLNIMDNPIYAKQPEIVEFFKLVGSRDKGQNPYEVQVEGKKSTVFVEAYWTTFKIHGAEWKIVATRALNSEPEHGMRKPMMIGLVSVENSLRKLATDESVKKAMLEGKSAEAIDALKKFFDANRGLYSVQWVDAKGVNRGGYPKENSVFDRDLLADPTPSTPKFIEALKNRKETTFEERLFEGMMGEFFMVPVGGGDNYAGMLYLIKLK